MIYYNTSLPLVYHKPDSIPLVYTNPMEDQLINKQIEHWGSYVEIKKSSNHTHIYTLEMLTIVCYCLE